MTSKESHASTDVPTNRRWAWRCFHYDSNKIQDKEDEEANDQGCQRLIMYYQKQHLKDGIKV
jgi:hypothetical protein